MVMLFAYSYYDENGSFRNEGVKAHPDVFLFLLNMAYLPPDLRILDYNVGYSLAETSTGIMLSQFQDPVDRSIWDCVFCKMPDHPSLQNRLLKIQKISEAGLGF